MLSFFGDDTSVFSSELQYFTIIKIIKSIYVQCAQLLGIFEPITEAKVRHVMSSKGPFMIYSTYT